MLVLNDPKHIPERIVKRSDQYPFADVLQLLVSRRTEVDQPLPLGARIFDAPVGNSRFGTLQPGTLEWHDSKLEATDVEADVERFIEVRLHAGDLDIPLARGCEVCCGVLGGAQSQESGIAHCC